MWSGARAIASSRWAATATSIWVQCTSGSSYCLGMYSPLLKSPQSTLDAVAFSMDVGVLSGLLYSSAAAWPAKGRGGPWVVLAAWAVQCFAGYFPMWMSVTGRLPRPPVALMCLCMFLVAHAQTFFNSASVVTAVRNFLDNRGTAVGVMKGFLGLSGAILIQMYRTIYADEPSRFILMLALLPSLLRLLVMPFVNVDDTGEEDDTKHLNRVSAISLLVAIYLVVLIICENISHFNVPVQMLSLVILLLLVSSPLHV